MQTTTLTPLQRATLIALALLALLLPFEVVLFRVGPLALTSLELLLGLTVLLVAALVVSERRWRRRGWLRIPRAWLWLWAAITLAVVLSALLAPTLRLNALKGSGRLLAGMTLALAVPQVVRSRRQAVWVLAPLLLGAVVALGAGFVEVLNGRVLAWLDHFRVTATAAGPFLRLTGSFGHANQAAMFLEATLPLLLALGLALWRRRAASPRARPLLAAGVGLVLLFLLQAAVYTYSRTSVVTILASMGAGAALLLWRRRRPGGLSPWPWAAVAVAMLVVIGLNLLFNPVMRMRASSEGDNEWYDLSFQAPEQLTLEAGHTVTTTVTVHNEGLLTWADEGPNAVTLGGRWYLPGDANSLAFVPRWPLPETVRPGEPVTVQAALRAPGEPGTYRLQWDMIQEDVTWFSYKNGTTATTAVTVVPGEEVVARTPEEAQMDAALAQVVDAPPQPAPVPDRRTLWRVAASHFSQRPLLGIGLDNFRLRYGESLENGEWNPDIHANNWYIETLVSVGLLGALPFFAWMILLGISMVRVLGRKNANLWQTATAVGLIAYFIHGLLDYFLMFNDTGMLFWLLTGLWISQYDDSERLVKGEP